MRRRLQLRQAFSYLRGLRLGRVTFDNANTDLGGVFSRRPGYEICCQVQIGLAVDLTCTRIHQKMMPVATAKQVQSAPVALVNLVTRKHYDRVGLLRVINYQVSARLKKQQHADEDEDSGDDQRFHVNPALRRHDKLRLGIRARLRPCTGTGGKGRYTPRRGFAS